MNRKFKIKIFGRRIGFTLTELLIVVVILGILATLALPMLVKAIEKAKVGEAISNLNLIRTGQKIYFLENAYFAGGSSGLDSLNIENPNDTTNAFFDYSITTDAGETIDFNARAQRKSTAPSPYNEHFYDIQSKGTVTGPLL
ncbi:MAG: prepilin-type N-terminal cleavage/methylation domain-containing protein [Candidatus Omnitrophica bacterium]|nr:prepilin-type N-terminal cleavage/methylation domain-containing protein [Candidatus Omnitrophota bacterium]